MNKTLKFNFILLALMILLFSGCKSKPDMAYEQEDGGAVQDIDAFDVEATAEILKKHQRSFLTKQKE